MWDHITHQFLTNCISQNVNTRAFTPCEDLGCYSVWAPLVVGAGVVSPLSHVQQTSNRCFKKCHMQMRVQTILNELPEIHKQQLPPLCARPALQVVRRDLQELWDFQQWG